MGKAEAFTGLIGVIIPSGKSRGSKADKLIEQIYTYPFSNKVLALRTDGDKGFTAAVNDGLRELLRNENVKLFWVLNDDVEIDDDSIIQKLIEFRYDENYDYGIMGHKIVSLDDKDSILFGGAGDPFPAGMHKTGRVSKGDLNKITRERWITFASAVITRECLVQVGLLDEKLSWIYSDSDFCYRARWAGFQCVYNPDVVIYHKGGISSKPTEELRKKFIVDQTYFAMKWIGSNAYRELNSEILD